MSDLHTNVETQRQRSIKTERTHWWDSNWPFNLPLNSSFQNSYLSKLDVTVVLTGSEVFPEKVFSTSNDLSDQAL
jgi:hypothetical protein